MLGSPTVGRPGLPPRWLLVLGLLLVSNFPLAAIAQAEDDFLIPGRYYNFYFVREHDPLHRGDVSIRAVQVLQLGKGSWAKIRFPQDAKEHGGMIGARMKDLEAFKQTGAPTSEHLQAWENEIQKWNVMWVNLHYVTKITDVEEIGLKSVQEKR